MDSDWLLIYFEQQAKDTRAEDAIPKEVHVKRTEYQWRPSPILCKRFDLIDPYMGKVQ